MCPESICIEAIIDKKCFFLDGEEKRENSWDRFYRQSGLVFLEGTIISYL
jgi:hypothetical protein